MCRGFLQITSLIWQIGKCGSEMLRNLAKVTELIMGRTGMKTGSA